MYVNQIDHMLMVVRLIYCPMLVKSQLITVICQIIICHFPQFIIITLTNKKLKRVNNSNVMKYIVHLGTTLASVIKFKVS